MNVTVKKIIRYALSAALAVALLWVSFRGVEWAGFVEGIKSCHWGYILLSMAAGAFAFWLRALRWRQLLLPFDPEVKRITTFNGINIGNISNFVFPRIGEFVRCVVITRHASVSYDKVLGTVVLERSWELLVMLIMLAIVVVGGYDRFGTFFIEEIYTPVTMRFSITAWWILLPVALMLVCFLLIWVYRNTNPFCAKVWGMLSGLVQGFASCLKMKKKWLFFAYTLFIWMTYWFMAICTMRAAPFLDGLDIVDALFLSLVGGIGFAVPVPGGIGAFHFVISLALSAIYGIPMEVGIIYATISHTSQAVTQILFGVTAYGYEAIKA